MYTDSVRYLEEVEEVAYRNGGVEINRMRAAVRGFRACNRGCWAIVSCQDGECREGRERVEELARRVRSPACRGLSDAELFRGEARLGVMPRNMPEVVEVASGVCEELGGMGAERCELVAVAKRVRREIEFDEGGEAVEEKVVVDLLGSVIVRRGARLGFGAYRTAFIPMAPTVPSRVVEIVLKRAFDKGLRSTMARPLNPLASGRATLVLSPEAAAALFHEVSHALEGTHALLPVGSRVAPQELYLADEPRNPSSPTMRAFDDEGVSTKRRVLIEDGVVVDHHHTRASAFGTSSVPGSAYGLFRAPTPFHTTLVVGGGDWGDTEILEETPRGFYIEGAALATLERGYVRIVPEVAYYIEKREAKRVVALRSVKIPLSKLSTINAIGRRRELRISDEKDYMVAELAPHIRIEGYVE